MRIELEDGKYTLVGNDAGCLEALRYGEPWRDLTGDKFVNALGQEIESLKKQRDELLAALEQFLDQDGCPPEYTGEWLEALRVIDEVKGGAA